MEAGCRGFVGICGRSLKQAAKTVSEAAREAEEWLWMRGKHANWGIK